MSKNKVDLKMIPSGLSAIDNVIMEKGGFPKYSINIVCGPPGSGKTIFCYQMLFANVSRNNTGICFTTISEPPIKVLRYIQQFSFFEPDKFSKYIRLVDIGMIIRKASDRGKTNEVIHIIGEEVEKQSTSIVVIDSFKAIGALIGGTDAMRGFIYDLGTELTILGCTTFLVGEYTEEEILSEPIFTIADGIIVLSTDRKGYLRRNYFEILKMRGEGYFAGRHRFLIDSSGITIYPRLKPKEFLIPERPEETKRLKIGVVGLDKMIGGGLYCTSNTLVGGPSGIGKTTLSLQFLLEGVRNGQKGLFVSFEESPRKLFSSIKTCEIDLDRLVKEKKIIFHHCFPVELSVDRFHHQLLSLIEKERPERMVMDAITDISITISDPTNLKNYLLSMINQFSELGLTSLFISEAAADNFDITTNQLSVAIDTIIILRYKEEEERIKRTISVLKMRGSNHDKAIREFEITDRGIIIADSESKKKSVTIQR